MIERFTTETQRLTEVGHREKPEGQYPQSLRLCREPSSPCVFSVSLCVSVVNSFFSVCVLSVSLSVSVVNSFFSVCVLSVSLSVSVVNSFLPRLRATLCGRGDRGK